uniref:Uncharacterized protein n=1 Tax=Anguilla anguilla TaxID=7936 RepID=A0A0E9UCV9_ANGAN
MQPVLLIKYLAQFRLQIFQGFVNECRSRD